MHVFPEELIEKVRSAIDCDRLLRLIDYRVETIQTLGSTIKAFCPIHREPIFRTLIVDLALATYRCSNKHCTGHGGGDMIDLYSRARGIGYEESIPELAAAFGVEVDLSIAHEYVHRAQEIADNYFQMGEFEDASEQYERILRFEPASLDALRGLLRARGAKGPTEQTDELALRLAKALGGAGEDAEAVELLRPYVQHHPDDTSTRLLYIECLKRLGNNEWVAGEYINLADQLSQQGEVDQALEIYRRIDEIQVDSIDVSLHIVQTLTSAGRGEEAAAELLRRADHLSGGGDFTGAIACLGQALDIEPEQDELRVRIARLVADHKMNGEPLQAASRQVHALLQSGSHGPAAQALDFLLDAFPESVALLELKGDLEEARGHDEAALEIRMDCADRHEQRREYEEALTLLDKTLTGRPEDVDLLSRRARLLRDLGRTESAVGAYLSIVSLFEAADELDQAAAIYQTIIELEPEDLSRRLRQFDLYLRLANEPLVVKTALSLAEAHETRSEKDEAEALLARALEVAPESAELLSRHAELLEDLGRRGEAAEQFFAVARIFMNRRLYERARERLERALASLPEHVEARELRADAFARQAMTLQAMSEYGALAEAYLSAGEPENVIRVARKILAIQPDHLSTLQALGAAYGQAGAVEDQRSTQLRLVQLYRQGQSYTRAGEICDSILAEDRDYTPAIEQLVAISEATGQSARTLDHLWSLTEVYARRAEREREQAILDRILAHEPLHRMAWQRALELRTQWATPRALADAVTLLIEKFTEAGRPGETLQILETLRGGPTPKPEITAGLVRLRSESGDVEGMKQALREQADLLRKALREEEAIDVLGELADLAPEDTEVRRDRIALMMRTDQNEEAVEEHRLLARIYSERHRLEEAEAAYRELLRLCPTDSDARDSLITLYISLGRLTKAADAIEELAAHFIRQGALDQAAAVYERVFEYDPKREDVFRKIIAIKQRAGDKPGALAYYTRLLDFLAEEGRSTELEQTASEAIAFDPQNFPMRERLIEHLIQAGRASEAETALLELAEMQIKQGDIEPASAGAARILELNPTSIAGRALRAQILARKGDSETALSEFMSLASSLASIRPARADTEPFALGNYEGMTRVKNYTFEQFVVGSRNNFAHATALAVSRAPGKNYNPLFLYSDVGLGKTHLCHAVANYVLDHHPDLKVMYTMTEDFIGGLIDGIQNNSITAFRNRHRLTDVLIIDDIQFLSGKERAQEEFFHIFNALYEAGKQILITSDRPAKDISHLEKRLRSRFGAGIIVDIQSPDLETRIAIVRKELIQRKRNDEMDDEAVLFLAENIPHNVRDLKGALNQVLAHNDIAGAAIDLDLIRSVVDRIGVEA